MATEAPPLLPPPGARKDQIILFEFGRPTTSLLSLSHSD